MLGEELYVRIARLHRLVSTDVGAGPSVAQARTLGRLLADGRRAKEMAERRGETERSA